MNQNHDWAALAASYPTFAYQGFAWQIIDRDLVITFDFAIEGLSSFKPEVRLIDVPIDRLNSIDRSVIDTLVFQLGLAESVSYWKVTASPTIKICRTLATEQIAWWQALLQKGLGEYAYRNQIPLDHFANVPFENSNDLFKNSPYQLELTQRPLIPIGGGKDSAVVSQVVPSVNAQAQALLLNPSQASFDVAKAAGFAKPLIVRRTIDPALFKLNDQGFLNGHTPFSAYLGFLSVLTAVVFDYQDLVLANERSANEGNMIYQGQEINHQYSKTFDFEQKFHAYSQTYLASNVNYFSYLRPLYEIQIAKIFAKFPHYFSAFRSCNVGQKSNQWCGQCAKCAFVYCMLYPFVDIKVLLSIFDRDLYTDENLKPIFQELLGVGQKKPFECVGTYAEVRSAMYLASQKSRADQSILRYYIQEIMPSYPNLASETQELLDSWNEENIVPQSYADHLKGVLYD